MFSIDGAYFGNVSVGNNGGALFLNVSQIAVSANSYIQNSRIEFCSAAYGGGIYIARAGVLLFNVNFTNNVALQTGSDIFENKTQSDTFYSSSLTLQFCCSDSTGVTFALADNTDKSDMMPECIPPSGERYLSVTNSYDLQNTCLNQDTPCLTLGNAILSGQAAFENTISVTVLGEFQDTNCVIPVTEIVHIHGPGTSQSLSAELYFFIFVLFEI
jgi:hypothetical protein